MKNYFLFALIISVPFLGIGQSIQDKELVYKVIVAFQEDFNEGSFKNAKSYTTNDWEHVNPNGGISKGRENVLKEVREVHKSFLKNVSMKIESYDIRFITPKVAIANAVHQIDNFTTPDNKQHINERHIKTYILLKHHRKWRLIHDHNTVISM